jgi:ribonucleoside-diphosphate reductase alpha chain
LLARNVSSGIEPVFSFAYKRRVLLADGARSEHVVEDFAHAQYRALHGTDVPLTAAFVTAENLSPRAHLVMQAAAQKHIDSSISKTINCPQDMPFDAFGSIYLDAYDLGLKGCTTYRPNETTGAVLVADVSPSGPSEEQASDAARGLKSAKTAASTKSTESSKSNKSNEDVAETYGSVSQDRGRDDVDRGVSDGASRLRDSVRETGDVVYLSEPLARADALQGVTYKLKWPGSDHAMYVTINDTERNGRRRPFEIFINSKNLEHYAWTLALTRMISAVFRRGGDVSFVVEELKAVFDPQGGRWMNGAYVPSLLAAIGGVIDQHLHAIGFHGQSESLPVNRDNMSSGSVNHDMDREAAVTSSSRPSTNAQRPSSTAGDVHASSSNNGLGSAKYCPQCASATLVRQEGCWTCHACGYSKCS